MHKRIFRYFLSGLVVLFPFVYSVICFGKEKAQDNRNNRQLVLRQNSVNKNIPGDSNNKDKKASKTVIAYNHGSHYAHSSHCSHWSGY